MRVVWPTSNLTKTNTQKRLCLKDHVKVQHPDLLTDTLTVFATQGWQKSEDVSFVNTALQNLSARFEIPLQKAQVDIALLEEEWEDMAEYAKRYLNLVQEDYRMIWWKLFNSVDSKKWANILSLVADARAAPK